MTLNVGKIGMGLAGFTSVPSRKFTQDQFNRILRQAIELNKAAPLLLNAGEWYGIPDRHENLKKLGSFFESYPEDADNVIVSVKGGITSKLATDNSAEALEDAFTAIRKYLKPLFDARKKLPKTLDYYTVSRLDDRPIKEILENVAHHKEKGDFHKLCLSEIDGKTLKQASEIYSVDMIEVEFSLFDRESFTNGSLEAAGELGIPVVAYSPLGRGLIVGIKPHDLPKDDFRLRFDKFQPDIVEHNSKLVNAIAHLAKSKNVTSSQIALSWIVKQSGRVLDGVKFPQIIPIPCTTKEVRVIENSTVVDLTDKDLEEINGILGSHEVKGVRYVRRN